MNKVILLEKFGPYVQSQNRSPWLESHKFSSEELTEWLLG